MVKEILIEHMLIQWTITKITGADQVSNSITKMFVFQYNGTFMVITLMVVVTMITIAWNTMISN